MPRTRLLYTDFFYAPLTEDVEELLARFQQTDSIRFEVFSAIWRDMGFSDVFTGITSIGERKRFTRVALATAVKYFLPPYSYQIQVGGLYLMFAMYHTQLTTPPVKIRLALKDWALVQMFLRDSVDCGHQDVVYIFHKLVAVKAIHYAAMPQFLNFQKQRKPKKEPVCAEFIGRAAAIQELLSSDLLEEVANIQSQYEKLKEAAVEVRYQATMTHRDFTARLKDCMSEFMTWQHNNFSQGNKDKNTVGSGEEEDEEEEDEEEKQAKASNRRARLLSSIKRKSYSNFQDAPKSRRHRQAETVDSSSSGTEQGFRRRKRPPSLRARTWRSLGVTQEECHLQKWLLSAPDQQERLPVKRTPQRAPFKP